MSQNVHQICREPATSNSSDMTRETVEYVEAEEVWGSHEYCGWWL